MLPSKALFFIFIACLGHITRAGDKQNVIIEIKPVFAGRLLTISTATYVSSGGDTLSIDRFRFYVSAIVLTLENGEKFIEQNSYHLIDVEDPSSFIVILQNVPTAKISSIDFNIGVDSTASVSGALAGELDPVKGMYWAWNSGYINAKLEGTCKSNKGKKNHPFEFHVGGYLLPHYAIRSVKLNLQTPGSKIILMADASAWLDGVDLKKENSVMIPGREAMQVADKYSKMFSTN
ncbi:MAG: hypothetical protein K0S53_109 [Bacteroidetes bacterium]|jgi:hypothetical protein|nr:hypothetical protein [Bacteroidota bacterium]MDF2450615.1 hypothetical protein [Bacteroidota bacterium]